MRVPISRRITIKTRIITGLVALPLLILLIHYADPLLFRLFIGLVTLLALHEFYVMSLPANRQGERWLAAIAGAVMVAVVPPVLLPALFAAFFLLFAVIFLLRFGQLTTVAGQLALLLFGLFYVGLLLIHLPWLRELPYGREWIFLVLVIVMAGDSGAYFTGISIGRRKLYPAISPNKSVEGAIGGLAGSLLGAWLAKVLFFPVLSATDVLLLGLGLGVLGQIGDLFESMLKRSFGVKDSGALIPGHGGILDRLDSLLFAFAPAYYYAFWIFPGSGP
jgi:phosphatidate cytidylyltransferase